MISNKKTGSISMRGDFKGKGKAVFLFYFYLQSYTLFVVV